MPSDLISLICGEEPQGAPEKRILTLVIQSQRRSKFNELEVYAGDL
jgi:hypothetical protein